MVALTILLGLFFQFHHRCQQVFHQTYSLPAVVKNNVTNVPNIPPPRSGAAPDPSGGVIAEKPELFGGDLSSGTGAGDEGQIFFSDPFNVRDHENIEIRVRVSGANFWLGVDGDLVDEQTGVVQEFSLPVEYYEGVSDGESWSEGSREASAFLSALPAGQYMLRIVGHHEPPGVPLNFEVSVYESVARFKHWLLALAGVSLIPVIALLLHAISGSRNR